MKDNWHRCSPVSVIYHLISTIKTAINMWPALAGIVAVERSRELLLSYGAVSLIAIIITVSFIDYFFFRYRYNDNEIQIRKGLFNRKRLTLSLDRIQEINLEQSLYFRPFSLWSVELESAGSNDKPIAIPGISWTIANEIKHLQLEQHKLVETATPSAPSTDTQVNETSNEHTQVKSNTRLRIELTYADLVRAGLMHNGLIYPLVIIGPLLNQNKNAWNQIVGVIQNFGLTDWALNVSQNHSTSITILLSIAAITTAVGFVYAISVLVAITRFWQYRMTVVADRFQYKTGLFSLQQRGFRQHKLQNIVLKQGLVAMVLQRYTVKIVQTNEAATQAMKNSGFVIPVATLEEVVEIKNILGIESYSWKRAQITKPIFRSLILCTLTLLVIGSISLVNEKVHLYYAAPTVLIFASSFFWRWYREGYAFTENWLAIKSGFIGNKVSYTPYSKVQKVDLMANPLTNISDAGNISIWNGANLQKIYFVNLADLKQERDHIIHKVANFRGRWI